MIREMNSASRNQIFLRQKKSGYDKKYLEGVEAEIKRGYNTEKKKRLNREGNLWHLQKKCMRILQQNIMYI